MVRDNPDVAAEVGEHAGAEIERSTRPRRVNRRDSAARATPRVPFARALIRNRATRRGESAVDFFSATKISIVPIIPDGIPAASKIEPRM